LEDDSVVSSLSKETQMLLKGEQLDAEQIVNLDIKTNEILLSMKNQDDKLGKLYSDECVLQNQRVSPEQLSVKKLIGAFDVSSLMSVKVTLNIHSGGYSIVYTVPEVAETFVLKYVKVLPLLL
jgi:ATP-dependent Clp protease adapter protein ClpS